MSEVDGRPLCDEPAECCRCRENAGHDGPHACPCGGSWFWQDGQFRVVAFPPPQIHMDLLAGDEW